MNLYLVDVHTKKKERDLQVLVHATSEEDARAHLLEGRFRGCRIDRVIELDYVPKHFILAELEDAEL